MSFIINATGPSGSGKSYSMKYLKEYFKKHAPPELGKIVFVPKYTTRPERPGLEDEGMVCGLTEEEIKKTAMLFTK